MLELWLIVSTVCFPYVIHPGFGGAITPDVCVQQVSISTFQPTTKEGETVYQVVKTSPPAECECDRPHEWLCMHSRMEGDTCGSSDNFKRDPIGHCSWQQCKGCGKWRKRDKCGRWVEE